MRKSEALAELELGEGATDAQIKAAYRDLVKVWHPDRFGADERLRQRAEERLQRINEAYAALESGDLEPELLAEEPPQAERAAGKRSEKRGSILAGWGYVWVAGAMGVLAVVVTVVNNRTAQTAAPQPAATAPAAAGSTPRAQAGSAATASSSSETVRVTHLTEAQQEQMNAACGGYAAQSTQYEDCVRTQLGAVKVDLSALTEGERTSVEHVCAGAASYNQCASDKLAGLAAEPERPDLRRLSARDRRAVEKACISARDHDGPAAYDRCATEFEKVLAVKPQ